MVSIKPLSGTTIETIHETFIKSFADYVEPFSLSLQQLTYMLERRGCIFDLSFGAFHGNELVGIILNGIGEWNGKLTAYDTGTGVIKEFRKKGVATKIFNDSLPILCKNNISQYLLEVIRTNHHAFELYRKSGFKVIRELDYYVLPKDSFKFRTNTLNFDFQIKSIENPNWELLRSFWDFHPSWQNSIESICRKFQHFKILGIFDHNNLIGYGIIEHQTGDIPQLGIKKDHRRIGLATTLLKSLLTYSKSDEIRIINTSADYEPFLQFAKSVNLNPGHGQYEMILAL